MTDSEKIAFADKVLEVVAQTIDNLDSHESRHAFGNDLERLKFQKNISSDAFQTVLSLAGEDRWGC